MLYSSHPEREEIWLLLNDVYFTVESNRPIGRWVM